MNKRLKMIFDHYLYLMFSARAVGIKVDHQDAEEVDKYIRDKSQEFMDHFRDMTGKEIMLETLINQMADVHEEKESEGHGEE